MNDFLKNEKSLSSKGSELKKEKKSKDLLQYCPSISDSPNFLIDYWWIIVIVAVVGLGCIIGFAVYLNKKKRNFSGIN